MKDSKIRTFKSDYLGQVITDCILYNDRCCKVTDEELCGAKEERIILDSRLKHDKKKRDESQDGSQGRD